MLPPVKLANTKIGQLLLFDGPDGINRTLMTHGEYEPLNLLIAQTLVRMNKRPGSIVDGGANLGAFTIPLARTFVKSHTVHAFEAQRVVFQQLCANAVVNRLDNVHAHHVALSDADGVLTIPEPDYATDANVGALSVNPDIRAARRAAGRGCATDEEGAGARSARVRAIRLDSLELTDVRLVKLDVEGHEAPALAGMAATLERSGYPSLMLETWEPDGVAAFAQARDDLFGLARSMGYAVTPLGELSIAQHRNRPTMLRLSLAADGVTISGEEVPWDAA